MRAAYTVVRRIQKIMHVVESFIESNYDFAHVYSKVKAINTFL